MPKSNLTQSSTSHKLGSDQSTSRMSDVALRKKKNADAQAAFRARRANYIATLEETVTTLESVVLQLQASCKEAHDECQELRHDNIRLRHEFREREFFWRALWQSRKTGQDGESDDLPPLPALLSSTNGNMAPLHLNHHGNMGLTYRTGDDASICNSSYDTGPSPYHSHPPGGETDTSGNSSLAPRPHKYSPYLYPMHAVHRETSWPSNISQTGPSGSDSGAPNAIESTSSEMPYTDRLPMNEIKSPFNLDTAPYVFSSSRSLSPTSSTPGSSSSSSLASFHFGRHDRPYFDYGRHSHHGPEVTLHGGTADISLAGSASDAVRYRLGPRHAGPDRSLLPTLPLSGSDNSSQHEHGSSDGDCTPSYSNLRRNRAHSYSRSPSPGAPAISGTLAVIKAQAFGALRRTRTRTKKSSEGVTKIAMDILEARGMGMSVPAGSNLKRQRLDDQLDTKET